MVPRRDLSTLKKQEVDPARFLSLLRQLVTGPCFGDNSLAGQDCGPRKERGSPAAALD
jgi:hypothetical protein